MAGSLSRQIQIAVQLTQQGFNQGIAAIRAQLAAMRAEVDENDAAFRRVGAGLAVFGKGVLALSALSGVISIVAATTAALQNLLPIVLLAPAAILTLGAAFATFKIATAGFGDALKSGDLSKLSPQAAAAATAIRALGPAFDVVRKSVQDAFFKDFAADVKQLGATYLPILGRGLPKIAAGFNEMGRSVAFALTRPTTSAGIETVLSNTAKLLGNARNALGAFIAGFVGLGAAGSKYLPQIGIAIDGVAQRFQRFVDRITTDGSFERFVDNAVQGFRDLFNIIGDVSAIVGSIFSGLAGPQGDVLASLRLTTEALRAFFTEASTQTALGALGDALRTVADAVRNVLIAALEQLAPIIANLAPVVAEIATLLGDQISNAIGIVGPLLVGLTGFLKDHKEIVALVADALLILYARFLVLRGITVATAAIAAFGTAIGGLAGALRLIPLVALAAIAVEIDKINVAAAGGDTSKLDQTAETLNNLVGAGKQLLTLDIGGIVADISDELAQAGQGLDTGSSPIGSFLKTLTDRVQEFARVTKDSFDQIGGFFRDLGTRASDFATTTGESVGKIIGFFRDLPTNIGTAIGDIGAIIGQKASDIWSGFLTNLEITFGPVRDFFAKSPFEMGKAIGENVLGPMISAGIAAMTALRDGAVTGFEAVRTFFAEAPQKIADALVDLGTFLGAKAVEGWESFRTAAETKLAEIVAATQTLPGRIGTAIASLVETLRAKATEAWESFKAATVAKLVEVVAYVATIPGKIISIFNPLPAQTGQKGTETGTGFKNGLTTAFEAAIAYVRGIPGAIVSALGNVGNLLVTQGRAILDGLTAGMRAGYTALLDFARGIAAGIAAVKGPLSYDKRVLTPAGLALMSGLRAGIETGYADVRRFASGIADDLASTIDTGTIIAGASAAATRATATQVAAANPTVDLLQRLVTATTEGQQVHVYIGETELTQLVDAQVSTANRSTARTVRAGAGTTY